MKDRLETRSEKAVSSKPYQTNVLELFAKFKGEARGNPVRIAKLQNPFDTSAISKISAVSSSTVSALPNVFKYNQRSRVELSSDEENTDTMRQSSEVIYPKEKQNIRRVKCDIVLDELSSSRSVSDNRSMSDNKSVSQDGKSFQQSKRGINMSLSGRFQAEGKSEQSQRKQQQEQVNGTSNDHLKKSDKFVISTQKVQEKPASRMAEGVIPKTALDNPTALISSINKSYIKQGQIKVEEEQKTPSISIPTVQKTQTKRKRLKIFDNSPAYITPFTTRRSPAQIQTHHVCPHVQALTILGKLVDDIGGQRTGRCHLGKHQENSSIFWEAGHIKLQIQQIERQIVTADDLSVHDFQKSVEKIKRKADELYQQKQGIRADGQLLGKCISKINLIQMTMAHYDRTSQMLRKIANSTKNLLLDLSQGRVSSFLSTLSSLRATIAELSKQIDWDQVNLKLLFINLYNLSSIYRRGKTSAD